MRLATRVVRHLPGTALPVGRGTAAEIFRRLDAVRLRAGARVAPLWIALLLGGGAGGCAPPPPPAPAPARLDSLAREALDLAAERYLQTAAALDPATGYPRSTRPDGTWRTVDVHDWTSGFFPGTLWYLYEHTGDPALREQADRWTWPLAEITRGRYDHDLGFQFLSSFGNAYRLTGEERYRGPLLDAARHLAARYNPRVGLIRSWDWGEWSYPVIVDNLMNLELLLRAQELGGDSAWVGIARSHADRTLQNHLRADGGTFHVVDYDPQTGRVVGRMTRQGFADTTTWARGQAWGIYGYTMLFRETGEERYLQAARRLVDYVLPRLPEDAIPCWDYQAPGCPETAERDASAAAIMASALLELSTLVPEAEGARYRNEAERMLASLLSPRYLALGSPGSSLLLHSVGDYPRGSEVDVGINYADYYFVEALLRYLEPRAPRPPAAAERAAADVRLVPVGEGWARSSVNAVIFRGHSVASHGDAQYTAYYDPEGRMVLAKRRLGTEAWEVRPTPYRGSVHDAHNAISIAVDGHGVLHVAWDHHGQPLNYARGTGPGSLELTAPLPMTGQREGEVTYPQFQLLPDGGLLFLYREGRSGGGDVLLNRYDLRSGAWRVVQHPLIDGQGARNAYANPLVVDSRGGWHLSWTWRETPDVATNHDILYAYSPDQGHSWLTSAGEPYALPITAARAEVVREVGQGSTLINQTSMAVDDRGRPLIATYWRPESAAAPQFHLVWFTGRQWRTSQVGERSLDFRLGGGGTKRIPVSRPLVLAGDGDAVYIIFRDQERGGGITAAVAEDPTRSQWRFVTLDPHPVGMWEPTHDPTLWSRSRALHLFHQPVGQGDAETLEELPPQPVSILEWRPR